MIQINGGTQPHHTLGTRFRGMDQARLLRQEAVGPNLFSIVLEGLPYRGRMTEVFGYLGVPKQASADVPGMLLLHGGGGRAFPEWVAQWTARGFAALAIDLGGQDAHGDRHTCSGPPQDNEDKLEDPAIDWDNHWFHHAVVAAVRGHTILRHWSGVQAERTGVVGISWGGVLACLVAGVDPRFRCGATVYGCGGLPDHSFWSDEFACMSLERRHRWVRTCDPLSYLPKVQQPMLFVNGTNDPFFPMDSFQRSHQAVSGPVTVSVQPDLPHDHEPGWLVQEVYQFAEHHLRGGPLARLGALHDDGQTLSADVDSEEPPVGAEIFYSRARGAWRDYRWECEPAIVSGTQVVADWPPEATHAYLAIQTHLGSLFTTAFASRSTIELLSVISTSNARGGSDVPN